MCLLTARPLFVYFPRPTIITHYLVSCAVALLCRCLFSFESLTEDVPTATQLKSKPRVLKSKIDTVVSARGVSAASLAKKNVELEKINARLTDKVHSNEVDYCSCIRIRVFYKYGSMYKYGTHVVLYFIKGGTLILVIFVFSTVHVYVVAVVVFVGGNWSAKNDVYSTKRRG